MTKKETNKRKEVAMEEKSDPVAQEKKKKKKTTEDTDLGDLPTAEFLNKEIDFVDVEKLVTKVI